MDSISLIIAALIAGMTKAASDIAPDAYQGLKSLIKGKFVRKSNAKAILAEHEKDPETYEAPLKKILLEAEVDQDPEIISAAQALLEKVKPQESASGKFNIVFKGDTKGIQICDRNTQTNTFSS